MRSGSLRPKTRRFAFAFLSPLRTWEKRVYTTTVGPLFSRSVAQPRGHRAKTAMVYTTFLGKQGKRVYTIGPERRAYTIEPQTRKETKKEGLHGGGVYFFLPTKNKIPCPSLPWSFRKHQGKLQKHQGFLKPCKTSRKHSKRPRKFPGTKTPRKQKHQGKEEQGSVSLLKNSRKRDRVCGVSGSLCLLLWSARQQWIRALGRGVTCASLAQTYAGARMAPLQNEIVPKCF